MTGTARRLIVNADDLGQSPGINRGILRAATEGIVTSSSLMVRWPAAADGAAMLRGAASIGLHVDLGEWTVRHGEWAPVYQVVDPADERAVGDELARQTDRFLDLVGAPPTHLDSHQHVHNEEPVRSLLLELAGSLGVPVRAASLGYCGSFYGQYGAGHSYPEGITVDALVAILDSLPEGVTELGCHPATGPLDDLDSMYRYERVTELATLCDPEVRRAVHEGGIELCSPGRLSPG